MNQLNTNVHVYSVNFASIYGLLCCRPTDLSSMFAVVVCIVVVVCVVDSQRELNREDKRLKSDAGPITRMKKFRSGCLTYCSESAFTFLRDA